MKPEHLERSTVLLRVLEYVHTYWNILIEVPAKKENKTEELYGRTYTNNTKQRVSRNEQIVRNPPSPWTEQLLEHDLDGTTNNNTNLYVQELHNIP